VAMTCVGMRVDFQPSVASHYIKNLLNDHIAIALVNLFLYDRSAKKI
jgi:hypothetical protein